MAGGMPTAEEIDAVLGQLLVPNNDVIKAAEAKLKEFTKLPASTPALLDRARSSSTPQVRQLAAVLARRKCVRHWSMLDAAQQQGIKEGLLHMVSHEPEHLVRRSVAEVVSSIAKLALPAGQWPELLDFMLQLSQSQHAEHREVSMVVFMSLTDALGSQMRAQFPQLKQIFSQGLQDPSPPVRLAALRAVGTFFQWLETEPEMAMGTELIPQLLAVAQQCIDAGDDDTPVQVFEMLGLCVEGAYGIIQDCVPQLVKFLLDVASASRLEMKVREAAMFVVETLCAVKPKQMKKKNMVAPILKTIFAIANEPGDDCDDDGEDDTDEMAPYKMGTKVLDTLAVNIPSKSIMPTLMHHVSSIVASPDKLHRRAVLYLVGTCAEGCAESLKENLESIVPWTVAGFRDPAQEVRLSACWALTQFAEFLQPELMEYHEELLPGILTTLQDPHPLVQKRGCLALEAFCDNLGEELVPFIEPMMAQLSQIFANPAAKLELRELAMSAVAAAAGAVGEAFKPYFQGTMEAVWACMSLTDEESLVLRARATECGGVLAASLGREVFEPHLQNFMQICIAGLDLDSNELREFTYGAFSNLAEILKEDMAPMAPTIIKVLLTSCESNDGISEHVEGTGNAFAGIGQGDSDDEDEDDVRAFNVRTAWLDEKASAVQAIGAVADGMGVTFLPYLEPCHKCMQNLLGYFHEDVRQNVVQTLKSFVMVSFKAHTLPLRQGGGPGCEAAVHPETIRLIDEAVVEYIRTMKDDDDKETVARACEALGQMLETIGPAGFQKFLQQLLECVRDMLDGKAVCQGGDEEEQDDDEDHDDILIDAVAELIGSLAKSWGAAFTPHFAALAPSLQKYLREGRGAYDKLMAVGTYSEVFQHIKGECVQYIPALLPVLAAGLTDQNSGLRRNCAFCCGMLCTNGSEAMQPFFMQILAGLEPLIKEDEEPEVRDNAVGAMARMLQVAPTTLPAPAILQVIFENAPLHGDQDENKAIVETLLTLIAGMPETLNPYLGQLVALFAHLLAEDKLRSDLDPEMCTRMVAVLELLRAQYAGEIMQLVAALPATHQEWLAANVPGQ